MADLPFLDPRCLWEMAAVASPAWATRSVSILSKVLPRQVSIEIGRRFFGSLMLVVPGFGIGTHLACFRAAGNLLCLSRGLNRFVIMSGLAIITCSIIMYVITSVPVAELLFLFLRILKIVSVVMFSAVSLSTCVVGSRKPSGNGGRYRHSQERTGP